MLDACLDFSKRLVESRKKPVVKKQISFEYDEIMADLVGQRIQAKQILKTINQIKNNGKHNPATS
jgi:hypothetical protein